MGAVFPPPGFYGRNGPRNGKQLVSRTHAATVFFFSLAAWNRGCVDETRMSSVGV
jgi:hypothetical protein